ncbi:MAG: DUF6520 family protein [Algibacter sp.]
MKHPFFKNSLAAFAFTIAIVASFAFTPAQNDVVEITTYEQVSATVCGQSTTTCDNSGITFCTVDHIIGNAPLYEIQSPSGTVCVYLLHDSRQHY